MLIDADPTYGDVSSAFGLPDDVHTIADLLPLVPELTPSNLDDALARLDPLASSANAVSSALR